ncbi:hypothetical protein KOM00_10280 [Geomonas sp. Red69]|uniref:Lipoprotein n=1 Tax=Geomonas diazotrophica TaxID=2843197 RepID=A0ABX8JNX9_9BACT|nr:MULTISPECIES: hypothetical protein [Geomonas]MBU5637119.1 hypothetical protein [Geomonas diazotrophica]QWV99418.1 hypothetical protein KP005_09130 [Geomonas nitrogeniifigens]QXE88594.1 hypothetical protein KP003_09425 [Geomonas nitrogeniifigens]
MRYAHATLLVISLLSLSACTIFEAKQQPQAQPASVKELSVPVGKNWKVVEEPPTLGNERRERLPFQTEQSVQPEGTQRPSAAPEEKERKIETTR